MNGNIASDEAIKNRNSGDCINALSVDVEDYFQVQALSQQISREDWNSIPRRVENNIDRLIALFDENKAHATFFVLGWIAERHPEMVRRMAAAGHEVASHGYDHRRVDELGPEMFREDVRRSKSIIEELVDKPVLGYRAPTFSIGARTPWAHEILEQEGYRYSSSTYPIRHDLYGAANGPRQPFRAGHGSLLEIPLTTRRLFGQNIPCAGGGYFRLLPYWMSRRNLRRAHAEAALPCIFYFHPWEIDAEQPRVPSLTARTRFRHYTNLSLMPARLERLTRDFKWGRIDTVFGNFLAAASQASTAGAARG